MYKNIGHTFYKKFSTSILLLGMIFCLHAAQISNYAEMGSALATIPLNTAANFCDSNKNEKRAAQLRMLSNLFSVINKSLFLYNGMYAKWAHDNKDEYEWIKGNEDVYVNNTNKSDYLINSAIALHDLAQIYINFKAYRQANHQKMQNSKLNDEDYDELDNDDELNHGNGSDHNESEEEFATANKDKDITLDNDRDDSVDDLSEIEELLKNRRFQEANKPSAVFIRTLISTLKKAVLPALKGSTAFALACMQPNVSYNSGKQIRSVLTATSLLTTLLDDYSLLKPDTGYAVKMPLILLITGCTVLLLYELNNFMNGERKLDSDWEPETPDRPTFEVVAKGELGHCDNCFCDNLELIKLPCGQHSRCTECIQDSIKYLYAEGNFKWDVSILANFKCEQSGCTNQPVTEDDLYRLLGSKCLNQHQTFTKWKKWKDEKEQKAAEEKAKKDAATIADSEEFIRNATIKCPSCNEEITKGSGCQYATCTKCKNHWCCACGKICQDHRHIGPECGFGYVFNGDLVCPSGCKNPYKNNWKCEETIMFFIDPKFSHTRKENGRTYGYAKVWCSVCKKTFFAKSACDIEFQHDVIFLREMPK